MMGEDIGLMNDRGYDTLAKLTKQGTRDRGDLGKDTDTPPSPASSPAVCGCMLLPPLDLHHPNKLQNGCVKTQSIPKTQREKKGYGGNISKLAI